MQCTQIIHTHTWQYASVGDENMSEVLQPMKRVKVEYNELAKSVSANVMVEIIGATVDTEAVRIEAEASMTKALAYAAQATMLKNR